MKHINKGRRPTMHHVSRTHRADLDWQCDRVNLDPRSQIKYVNTTQQLADILTKCSCTADGHLTLFVNVMAHTKFTPSNLLVSCAVVKPFFQHQ